ncbi:hypothetical protein D9611_014048 [Ephemerocybe angulata]|uniref:Uncharacterized protein n=1 Tax=Ephemerocybe angulata TaxID=980116 RepID=A0A8H5ARL2_9AGAR|nr:hypothetical protein D9611_014048 [Tulosesus angulatus]
MTPAHHFNFGNVLQNNDDPEAKTRGQNRRATYGVKTSSTTTRRKLQQSIEVIQAVPSSLDSEEASAHDGESSKLYSPRHNDSDVANEVVG